MNKGNQKLYLPVKSNAKHKLENKTKASCQVGNKAMKTKLANMLRGKERKKRRKNKNRFKKLKMKIIKKRKKSPQNYKSPT